MSNTPTERPIVAISVGEDAREGVRTALSSLGQAFADRISGARRIFLHPNLVTYHRPDAATNPECVRGVIDHISLIRSDVIKIGDAGFHDTKKAFDALDYLSLARSGNIEFIDLNDDATILSYAYTADLEKRPIGFSKTVAESDCNIVVVPAKMHSYYIVSLSAKTHIVGSEIVDRSPFGIYARWPWLHTGYKPAHLTLADMYAEHPADLAVIDGTHAMEGNGPANGTTINLGWVLASLDPIAADLAAAYLMGLEPMEIGYLALLAERGLAPKSINDITFAGSDPGSLRRDLKRPKNFASLLGWR